MQRLSSNFTLVLRIALPCMYISFFGVFIVAVFLIDAGIFLFSTTIFRMIIVGLYVFFILLMYFTIMKLKRVEYEDGHLFVSNYFKNYRYSLKDISSIKEYDIFFSKIVRITLADRGAWGRKLYFLAKKVNYHSFIDSYPSLKR